ncbi:hypothetical protein [Draconibacterium orientale]|uniref:hypothetical protein n=1 Tax=Draconibacterium orientale TaxID=1168034 RepID=UPI002A0A3304|nr:hypothetical protein [Draconibacterium orientale]
MKEILRDEVVVVDIIFKQFEHDYDLRFNYVSGEFEYRPNEFFYWKVWDVNTIQTLCNKLTLQNDKVFTVEYVKDMIGKYVFPANYKDFRKLTHRERMAENLLQKIQERMGHYDEFRYNVATHKIEYSEDEGENWREIPHYLLIHIRDVVSSFGVKYSWEEIRECLSSAPSIRYVELNQGN